MATAGGADRRSAKNADRPMNLSREAHHTARPQHSPEGHTARTLRTHGRPSMKRPGHPPCHGLGPNRAADQKPSPVGMTLPPAASAVTTLMSREARDMLSYRYATSPASSHTGYSTTKGTAQQGY